MARVVPWHPFGPGVAASEAGEPVLQLVVQRRAADVGASHSLHGPAGSSAFAADEAAAGAGASLDRVSGAVLRLPYEAVRRLVLGSRVVDRFGWFQCCGPNR